MVPRFRYSDSTRQSIRRKIIFGIVGSIVLSILCVAVFAGTTQPTIVLAQSPVSAKPQLVPMVGPVSLDQDLRALPYIPPTAYVHPRLSRHPTSQNTASTLSPASPSPAKPLLPDSMPAPLLTFGGMTSATGGCNCLPPDTDGDVGLGHYIQAVNSSIQIFDKAGNSLAGPTTYNSLFSALGSSTPCGNSNNEGDGIVFYDHLANRWVVSDFAFVVDFFGNSFAPYYQCIAVSKTSDPVSGGWWLYALQHDPSNTDWLGDYPKFGLWPDAYYLSVNLFGGSGLATFEGVRVYALNRTAMLNGPNSTSLSAIAFTISPTGLGNTYSLLPATFRFGAPPANTPEYFLAINSSATGGTIENQVFTWRFHVDFATPANSTFGVGVNHTPNGTITVPNFVEAIQGASINIVPQPGTAAKLDTLGDKLMYPLYYQNLNGTESLYAIHTVNNNQNGTGLTAIRWYQFDVTGSTIPSGAAQQQTFNNGGDGVWRWMPSLAVDSNGNLSIGYSVSSSSINPGIRYAGRLKTDSVNLLAQGEAILVNGSGVQTNSSGRWGDYSAMSVDPFDGCTFWHTNEYYSITSDHSWNTRIGNFKFPSCAFARVYLPLILR